MHRFGVSFVAIAELDVTRFHVGQKHAELGKGPHDRLDFRPTLAELLRLFFHPIG
ncbi:MAG: hypothetical protein FD138_3633 [Planctomycetota bacterium]|nr:MAG: hypothetical protein FD138_3633 [Planctomycetota bacterium]